MKKWSTHLLLIGLASTHLMLLPSLKAQEIPPPQEAAEAVEEASHAQTDSATTPPPANSTLSPSMEERSLENRGVMKIPDPQFIREGSSARTQGVYFGVGFEQVRLDFRHSQTIISNDGATNGVAFNLGYFTEKQVFEYARHVTILDLGRVFVFEDQNFNFVELIQSNWWYFRGVRFTIDGYAHYGLGLQNTEARLILKASQTSQGDAPTLETTSELYRENSLLIGGGGSYFFTPNFFIQYRFTYGSYSPLFTGANANNALHSTQIHTLFLQYYFPL